MDSNSTEELAICDVFHEKKYRIPLYQRNYAWEQAQTTQLIRDIWDYRNRQKPYYIGSLIVYKRDEQEPMVYEIIDGQQRLTTLHLLTSLLRHKYGLNLAENYADAIAFESRPLSSATLRGIADFGLKNDQELEGKMKQGYIDMGRELDGLVGSNTIEVKKFAKYLCVQVRLIQLEVPHDTDLNHYFEVMNSRGEQLEKHEILKARLLSYLKDSTDQTRTFTRIWDACAMMDRYMVLSFPRELRDKLFAQNSEVWNQIPVGFSAVQKLIKEYQEEPHVREFKPTSLSDLIGSTKKQIIPDRSWTGQPSRFTSVVTFSNFLLHVLRAMTGRDVKLDDKQLLQEFDAALKAEAGVINFIQDFGFQLLKLRLMFDNYVIKREQTDKRESWTLQVIQPSKSLSIYYANTFGGNIQQERLVMLLAMFHVSFPQPIYKHWLSGVMRYFYLQDNSTIDASEYIGYLESLSDAFYFDRFGEEELSYFDIVFNNGSIARQADVQIGFLNLGTGVQNFIFNRLDYLIWRNIKVRGSNIYEIANLEEFEFTLRSSVEHFYPQHPRSNIEVWPPEILDNFGNLCLISSRRNSALSNNLPMAKEEHYRASGTMESLKQKIMLSKAANWTPELVLAHGMEMIEILKN